MERCSEKSPSLVDRPKGKEYPSFWNREQFESVHDKRLNCNEIMRDTARNAQKVNNEQACARLPSRIKQIARVMWAGFMFVQKIRLVYVGWLETDLIPNPRHNDPFEMASEYHRALQYNLDYINRYLLEMQDPHKMDRMCGRLCRVNGFLHKMNLEIEINDRDVSGY